MHFTPAVLIAACLTSVAFAGPAWYSRDSCASECQRQSNYFYEIGRTYEYDYEVDTETSILESSETSAYTKVRAKVLIQPISECDYSLTLRDVSLLDSVKSEEFARALTKESLVFSFQDGKIDNVCNIETEPTWVVNFKKGILSTFQNTMKKLEGSEIIPEKDVSGVCDTNYNAKKEEEDSTIYITRSKDISNCKNNARNTINKLTAFGYSTEAFLHDLPLLDGRQSCQQEISDDIINNAKCHQTFILRPFSKTNNGAKTEVWTSLVLNSVRSGTPPVLNRFSRVTSLEFQDPDTATSEFSDENAVEDLLYRLQHLSENGVSREVPVLFSELVTAMRKLDAKNMQTLYRNNDKFAQKFIQDALMLVGTPESTQMIVELIQQDVYSTKSQEAWIASLSFIKNPKLQMFSAIQPLFDTKIGGKASFGISSMIHNYCIKHSDCDQRSEIISIIKSFESFLGVSCRTTSDEEKSNIIFALKALGNSGIFINAQSVLTRCYTEENDMEIRIAAIEAWRRTPSSYPRDKLLATFQDRNQDDEVRIASYLAVMVHPARWVIDVVKDSLTSDGVNQVSSFVWTHLTNLQESAFPEKHFIQELIGEEMLQKKFSPESLKFSKNYESSFMLNELNIGGMTEGNVIFSSQSYLPRSAMINFNVDVFGESIDLFEIGGRMEGFESYIENFFGKDGYYPEETIEGVLKNLRQQKQEEETMLESYLRKASNDPEGSFYMKLFGNELSYHQFHSLTELMPNFGFENPMDMLIELVRKGSVDYTKSFNILDADINYPTIAGFPLSLKVNGAATFGLKLDGNFEFEGFSSMDMQGALHPSAAINIESSMSIDAFFTKSGMKISSSMHSSSRIEGKAVVEGGKVIDLEIKLPKDKDVFFEFSNDLIYIEDGQDVKNGLSIPKYEDKNCFDFFTLSACYAVTQRHYKPNPRRLFPEFYARSHPVKGFSTRKFYLIGTESNSPLKFQLKKENHITSLLLIVPDNIKDIGFSMSFDKREKELGFKIDYPRYRLNHLGKAKFKLEGDEKEISYMISNDQKELYGAKLHYSQNMFKKQKSLTIGLTNSEVDIFHIDATYKRHDEVGDYLVKAELMSDYFPTQGIKIEYSNPNKHLSVDVETVPLAMTFKTQIKTTGEQTFLDVNGKIHIKVLYDTPKTFKGHGSYTRETVAEGQKYSGTLMIHEFGLDSNWQFTSFRKSKEVKMSGVFMDKPFNIDLSHHSGKENNALIDVNQKVLINIPAFCVDLYLSRSLFYNAALLKSFVNVKYNELFLLAKEIKWQFGEKFNAEFKIDTEKFNYEGRLSSIMVDDTTENKFYQKVKLDESKEIKGCLKYSNARNRFNAEFKGEVVGDETTIYKTEWDVNADRKELNVQGSLTNYGQLSTFFAKATPKSINISNTFYKPLSIEANMVTLGESKEIMITSSSEDTTFRAEGKISPNSLLGKIKVGEFNVGFTGSLNAKEVKSDVWWSAEKKISFSASYIIGKDIYVLATLMTPFKGYEKQDLKFTSGGTFKHYSQLSLTWANNHHFTLSHFVESLGPTSTNSETKITSTIDMLDDINLSVEFNHRRAISIKFTSPHTENLEILYKIHESSVSLLASYGTQYKLTVNGNMIDLVNLTGNVSLTCPFISPISLKGKLETGSANNNLEITGKICDNDVLLSFSSDTLSDTGANMCKVNVEFTVGATNIVTVNFDYQLLNMSEFKTDFEITSSLCTNFFTEGHIEGTFNSMSSAVLTGYITGTNLEGRINLNHDITNSKLSSEFEVTLNSFNLGYEIIGDVDLQKVEANLMAKIESSIPVANAWDIAFNHAINKGERRTNLKLSKGEVKFSINHVISYTNNMNWYNEVTINDYFGMTNVLKSEPSKMKFTSGFFRGEEIIKVTYKAEQTDVLLIESSFETPWTLPLEIKVTGTAQRAIKGHIEVTYGESKTIFDGGIMLKHQKAIGNVTVSNNIWKFTPLEIQFESNFGEEKSVKIKVTDNNSRTFHLELEHGFEKSMFKMELKAEERYFVHLLHDGTLQEGRIQTEFLISPFLPNSLVTQISYKYKPMYRLIELNAKSTFSEESYELNFKLDRNEMKITAQCPHGKCFISGIWKFVDDKWVISLNMEIPNMFKRSLEIFRDGNTVKICYTKDKDEFIITGVYNHNTLTISGTTPFVGYKNVNLDVNITSSSINADLIIEDRKYVLTCKINLSSFKFGKVEIVIETPLKEYKSSSLLLDYNFKSSRKSLNFNANIGLKHVIKVSFEKSSEEMFLKLMSPWTEKLSLKATFANHMIKVSGDSNEIYFNCTSKVFYDQKRKINIFMNFNSNIEGWVSYSVTADANASQKPYSAIIKIQKDSEVRTYSVVFNYDQESFSIETLTPLKGFETLRAAGKFYNAASYFKTYFMISNSGAEINFSSSVSIRDNIPEVNVKILTPFARFENIEFNLEGTMSDQKSFMVSAVVGQIEYYTNIYFKHENQSGKVGINIRSPFDGFRDISLNTVYNFSTTKFVKLNYNWNKDKLILDAKMDNKQIDVNVESTITEIKAFHMLGDVTVIKNGYKGQGFISINDVEYDFQGKAEIFDNIFDVELNLPSNNFFIKGSLLSDGLKVTLTKGSGIFAKNYDLKINYALTPQSSYLSIHTPFEFLSVIDLKLMAANNMLDATLKMTKYSEQYNVLCKINLALMKSNIAIKVAVPEYFYNLDILYDLLSEEKYAEFTRETSYSHMQYILKALLKHAEESKGYIKITTTHPNYSLIGAEYKIQSATSLNNIDSFIAIYRNELTTKFGLKTEFLDQSITCIVETPIYGAEKLGFKFIKDSHRVEAGIYFGIANLVFEVTRLPGEYSVNIEMPFETFSQAHLSLNYAWETYEKYGILMVKFNDHLFEINGTLKKSWSNPQLILKFITPFENVPSMQLFGSYNLAKHQIEAGIEYNDIHLLLSTELDATKSLFIINSNIKTPFMGWRDVEFLTKIDFSGNKRMFKIYLKRDGDINEIFLDGKLLDNDMDFENTFENFPSFRTIGSLNRSKRGVKDSLREISKNFNSLKFNIQTPYGNGKLDIVRTKKGFEIKYKRNDNFIELSVINQGKKKGCSVTIKSALPGWELLVLTGRLDLENIRAYVSAHKNDKKIEISGSGNFAEKQGKLQLEMTTPFEKFKRVATNFNYNTRRKIVTFESKSDSSDFKILVEFKRGLIVDIFVPHQSENTVLKGKLNFFQGKLDGSSRFALFRTFKFNYVINLGQKFTGSLLYERNSVKQFELDFALDGPKNTFHFEIHTRVFGNHNRVHLHRDGWNMFAIVFHRNGKELSIDINGSGDLPRAGMLEFTMDNSFFIDRHIKGSLSVDRTTSPKKLILKVEFPGNKLYVIKATYNASLGNLKKGDFILNITTPTKDRRKWKNISGNWNLNNKMLSTTLSVGPRTFKVNGKISILDTDLTIYDEATDISRFITWTIKKKHKSHDYYLKIGREGRYVMFKFKGTFNTIWNGDISSSFRASKYMKDDLKYTSKWSTVDGTVTGINSFTFGDKKGTTKFSIFRDPIERAAKAHFETTTNIPKINNVVVHLNYNLAKLMLDFKATWDTESFAISTTVDNFGITSSSNKISFHFPKYGDGELTLSHDFNDPLAKSAKAVGKLGNKKVSYIANWTRNKELTVFDFKAEANSVIFGSGTLLVGFDVQNLRDASVHLEYKRNNDKFVNIKWHRMRTNTDVENELTFSSHFKLLPNARLYVTADWSEGFHTVGKIEWKQSSIDTKADFTPGKLTFSITTPFKKAKNINFSLVYNMKGKQKTATLHYSRGSREVHLTFLLNAANKRSGSLDMDLKTPFPVLKHVSFNGTWKKGKFSAKYERNDEVQVDFEGTAEVKLGKSAIHVKFTPPNRNPIDLSFSYDMQRFVSGKGKKSTNLVDFNLNVAGQTIQFKIDGFRNADKVFIEVQGTTTLDRLSSFYLKMDSELNFTERVGHFEVRADKFYFKATNTFEKRENFFYARSQIDSSLTPLPGLIIGIGRDGDAFITTLGFGDDREITVSFKGKSHFRKGFSGKIDIPRKGIKNIQYDINYGFEDENKLQSSLKIIIDESRTIYVEATYDSDGVKARLTSPFLGNHSARFRRSIAEDHFLADIGVDNYGFTLEGNLMKGRKGFNLEGEIMGKNVKIIAFYDLNGLKNSEGKIYVKIPFIEEISMNFNISQINKELHGMALVNFYTHKIAVAVDFDLNNKFTGEASLTINKYSYKFSSDLAKLDNKYDGNMGLQTPFNKLSVTGSFVLNHGFIDISGNFKIDLNNKIVNLVFSHKLLNPESAFNMIISTNEGTKVKISALYPYLLKSANFEIRASKCINGKCTFTFNTKFVMKSMKELKGEIDIACSEPILSFVVDSFKTSNSVQGVLSTKIFNKHELYLRADIHSSDNFQLQFGLDSPNMSKISVLSTYAKSNNKHGFTMNIKTDKYTLINLKSDLSTGEQKLLNLHSEVMLPYYMVNYSISVNYLQGKGSYINGAEGSIMISDGSSKHTIRLVSVTDRNEYRMLIETTLFDLNRIEAIFSPMFGQDAGFRLELNLLELTHSIFYKTTGNPSIYAIGIIRSPIIPSGFVKIEATGFNSRALMEGSTHFLIDIDTISAAVDLMLDYPNECEIGVQIRTPFPDYEKLNFGIKYIIADVSSFSIEVSPMNLKAETFFGVSNNIFNAGIDIETGIETWELTKVEAHVPLNEFNPQFSAKVNGGEYGLELQRNYADFRGNYLVKGMMNFSFLEIEVDYRVKAPYHLGYAIAAGSNPIKTYGQSITFDSSFLYLVPAYYAI